MATTEACVATTQACVATTQACVATTQARTGFGEHSGRSSKIYVFPTFLDTKNGTFSLEKVQNPATNSKFKPETTFRGTLNPKP